MLRLVTVRPATANRQKIKIETPATTLQELLDTWFGLEESVRVEARYSGLVSYQATGYFQYPKFELLESLLQELSVIEHQFKEWVLPSINRNFFNGFLDQFYFELAKPQYALKDNVDIYHPDYQEARFAAEEALDNLLKLYRAYLTNNCMLKAFCAYEHIAVGDARIDLSDEVGSQVARVLSLKYPDPLLDELRNRKSRQETNSTRVMR